MRKYVATAGAPFPKRLVQKYGSYLLEVLPKRLGRPPTTDEIWKDARDNPRCPYRNYFTWDKAKAAENYWRVQARHLINHIAEVVVVEGKRKICRAFFPITERRGSPKRWIPMADIQSDPDMLDQIVDMARRELVYWAERYGVYSALKGVSQYIDRALRAIEKIRKSKKK